MKTKNKKIIQAQTKISKGYRLRPSTHKLIRQAQLSLNTTQDRIIRLAINLFRKEKRILNKLKNNK